MACGDDFLRDDTVRFVTAARDRGVPLAVRSGPGAHGWAYRDARIQDVLA